MAQTKQWADADARRRRPLVLVVDDHVEAQTILRENLELAGYEVQVASNGRDALAKLTDQTAPHLIVVDLVMPIMSGVELVEVLRSYRRLARIPVLLVSGVDDCPAHLHDDQVRFIRKPVKRDELLLQVAELLGSSPIDA